MKFRSACRADAPLVLYHAVSSYQLLEVMLHRLQFHSRDRAVLLLPDFITRKYPQYRKLRTRGFFDEVYLFPYLHIPHGGEKQILQDTVRGYQMTVPYAISSFSRIYVAGAHFYFSLYLLQNRIPFIFLEDAAGMLSHPERLNQGLAKTFPVHAAIARKYGLFTGENGCVRRIICLKRAQSIDVSGPRYLDFSVEEALQSLTPHTRRSIIRFFLKRRLSTRADAILLTQHFAHLGLMSEAQQRQLYLRLGTQVLQGVQLAIKVHPDDTLDYRALFPQAQVIREIFPSELLPYVFRKKPARLYTLDSTGCENLREHFIIQKINRNALLR